MSAPPPAAKGTMIFTALFVCADAADAAISAENSAHIAPMKPSPRQLLTVIVAILAREQGA
jgi:hypothetical protein